MRRRSASCAVITRRVLARRSASSRASVALKAAITVVTSELPVACSRAPGRSTSTVTIRSARRRSGARLKRSSTALAASISASPETSTYSCPVVAVALTLTGVNASTQKISTRIEALTAKTRA